MSNNVVSNGPPPQKPAALMSSGVALSGEVDLAHSPMIEVLVQ